MDVSDIAADRSVAPDVRRRVADPLVLAVGGYLFVRLVAIGLLWLWARSVHRPLSGVLGRKWDAVHYINLAQHGYDHGAGQSNLAFFPLYPGLVRVVDAVSPGSTVAAGIAVAWVAGLVAAWGIYRLGAFLHDARTGIALAVLWGVIPHAVVESMAYSESLFTALCVWSLYCVLARRWVAAGMLCLLAGLSRPTATALIAAVCLAALVAVFERPADWRPWAALVLAPLGWVGYLAWVAHRVGRADGWFYVQSHGWGSSFDGGRFTVTEGARLLSKSAPLDPYLVTLVLVIAVALFVITLCDRQPWPLLVYSALLLVTALGGAGYYHAKARFLVAAVPLLVPVAAGFAKARTGTKVVLFAVLTLVSGYLGGYLLLVWTRSP
ncbi:mannosyltransferase family protein [Actinomadura macrotermitis]|uniref:Glycosyltransferase RgtA/B/C/D-like domain-containing protein n=1 Tax=Actinomadura macrotermitis TaxID=2585200 RepID=A0A7K0C2V6_9ACTN|nr:mannosyltransferase family protein [Actinomadura macrotermitis]MQY07154.1 hypothetical protein [Actinomadura macrotermitis]